MFVKEVSQLVKPFLANLCYTSSNKYNTHTFTQWPENFFSSFLAAYEYSKYAEFYVDSVKINGRKSTQKKFFAKHICKLVG